MLKYLLEQLFPGGDRARLSILIFHRVLPARDELFPDEIDVARFDHVCRWLSRWFNVLPLDQAVECLKAGTLPPGAVSITFDDGYADNHDVALPVLRAHGLTATFFVATGYLDGGRMWNDTIVESIRRCKLPILDLDDLVDGLSFGKLALGSIADRRAAVGHVLRQTKYLEPALRERVGSAIAGRSRVDLPNDLMMSSAQVQALHRAGMQIGAHTVSHPILAKLDRAAAEDEIIISKRYLETLLEAPVSLFAYPNGQPHQDYSAETAALVKSLGFSAAVSTAWGSAATGDADMMQLPRFTPWDATAARFMLRLWRNTHRQPVACV